MGNKVPRLNLEENLPLYRSLAKAFEDGLVQSACTPAKGGWGLAFTRTVMAGEKGLDIDFAGSDYQFFDVLILDDLMKPSPA